MVWPTLIVGEPTVSCTPVTRDVDPLTPAMPTMNVPSTAFALAVRVSVADPGPAGIEELSNVAVTPVGTPNVTRFTPAVEVAVTVTLTEAFRSNLCEPGETVNVNGVGDDGGTLPQAVIAR